MTVSGKDQPGLMAMLTSLLARYQAQVLDIGQAVIHEELALGLLVHVPEGPEAAKLGAALKALAAQTGVLVETRAVSADDYREWAAGSGQPRRVITLLMRGDATAVLGRRQFAHPAARPEHRHGAAPVRPAAP